MERELRNDNGGGENTNNKMADLSTNISIIIFSINGLNTPKDRNWQSG